MTIPSRQLLIIIAIYYLVICNTKFLLKSSLACIGDEFILSEFNQNCYSIKELLVKFVVALKANHPNKIEIKDKLITKWVSFYSEHLNNIPQFIQSNVATSSWQEMLNTLGKYIYSLTHSATNTSNINEIESLNIICDSTIITLSLLTNKNLLDKVLEGYKKILEINQDFSSLTLFNLSASSTSKTLFNNQTSDITTYNTNKHSNLNSNIKAKSKSLITTTVLKADLNPDDINYITFELEKKIVEPCLLIIYTFYNQTPKFTELLTQKLEEIRNIWNPLINNQNHILKHDILFFSLNQIFGITQDIIQIYKKIPILKLTENN